MAIQEQEVDQLTCAVRVRVEVKVSRTVRAHVSLEYVTVNQNTPLLAFCVRSQLAACMRPGPAARGGRPGGEASDPARAVATLGRGLGHRFLFSRAGVLSFCNFPG